MREIKTTLLGPIQLKMIIQVKDIPFKGVIITIRKRLMECLIETSLVSLLTLISKTI